MAETRTHAGEIEDYQDAFARIERQVEGGETDLSNLGFWPLVRQVKLDPRLSNHWADVIGRIDARAFEARVRPRFPVWFGNSVLLVGTAVGVGAIVFGVGTDDPTWGGMALIASGGMLSVTLHDLAHWAVGRLRGVRFSSYFLDGPFRIQPGLKTDYASYLRVPPEARVAMHAAGALASKIAPFVSLGWWWASDAPWWAAAALGAMGLVQILTDIVWSTKKSDWKKVRRERLIARAHERRR